MFIIAKVTFIDDVNDFSNMMETCFLSIVAAVVQRLFWRM